MSLDARIRQLAREEAATVAGGGDGGAMAARCAELEQQLADQQAQLKDLHDHQHRVLTRMEQLAARVKTLEAAAAALPGESEPAPQRRTSSRRRSES
jgi:chromosome condensin MukBEF ATPase and DNA-binding subunit MukB